MENTKKIAIYIDPDEYTALRVNLLKNGEPSVSKWIRSKMAQYNQEQLTTNA